MDLYSFANGDPVNFVDPTGRNSRSSTFLPNGRIRGISVEHLLPSLYEVNRNFSGNLVESEITDLSSVNGIGAHIFVNGQSNDLLKAMKLGADEYVDKDSFYLIHNPTNGGLRDSIESAVDKLGFTTTVSKETANILGHFDLGNSSLYAHSQGAIIVNKSIDILNDRGLEMAGMNAYYNGAAVNQGVTQNLLDSVGGNLARFKVHPLDFVPNVLGRNASNPFELFGSMLVSPTLVVGGEWSPHTYDGGGDSLNSLFGIKGQANDIDNFPTENKVMPIGVNCP